MAGGIHQARGHAARRHDAGQRHRRDDILVPVLRLAGSRDDGIVILDRVVAADGIDQRERQRSGQQAVADRDDAAVVGDVGQRLARRVGL